MSMSTWDVPGVSSGENGNFDPSMGFAGNVDFDPSRMQNNQNPNLQFQQQQMQNGNFRHGSPAQNPMFQTSSVVPAKRTHSDYSASPSQVSRSQTPQQQGQGGPFPGYNPNVNGQQQAQGQFHHLQQPNSSNASPSPVMQQQNQNFNQQGMAQRMQTGSPASFPQGQGFGGQGSPPPGEQSGQFEQQANGAHPQMQGGQQSPGQGQNPQNFSPTPGNAGAPMQGSPQGQFGPAKGMTPEQQRMMYEARMRQGQFPPNSAMAMQQRQQMNAMGMMNMMGGQMNAMPGGPGQPGQGMSPQQQQQAQAQQAAAARAQQMQRMMTPQNPEQFARSVGQFMQSRGLPFSPVPQICGRQVPAAAIYATVMKGGGSRRISAAQQWPRVAQSLGFQGPQIAQAAGEITNYWQSNILPYEMMIMQQLQNQQRMAAGGQMPPTPNRMQMENGQMQGSPTAAQPPQGPPQGSPVAMQNRRQSSNDGTPLVHPGAGATSDPSAMQANGLPPSRDGQPPTPQQSAFPPKSHPGSVPPQSADGVVPGAPGAMGFPEQMPKPEEPAPPLVPERFEARSITWREFDGQGGVMERDHQVEGRLLPPEAFTNQAQQTAFLIERYGVDILDIIMRLKSGMPGEVRWALDMLSVSSVRRESPLALVHCEDLVDTLIDCAEDAMEQLAGNASNVSDTLTLMSYEDLIRGCDSEDSGLLDVHEPGSVEYELENAAERILSVMTLLRTYSSVEPNVDSVLADGSLARFLTTAIRYLGTRRLVMQSHGRTLDFMKDTLVLLSNVSLQLEFASKDEALQILHFLLAFAPEPLARPLDGEVRFPLYRPSSQHYLPLAVDVLAKLLARGDPNRAYLKALFLADHASETTQNLLTRTFSLSVSVVPCEIYRSGLRLQLVEERGSEEQPNKARDGPNSKTISEALASSNPTTEPSAASELKQLSLLSKLSSNIESILDSSVDSEGKTTRRKIQVLGTGNSRAGKWTARLPCLVSGMLAADILLALVPNGRPEIIRSWVESPDGLIPRLQRYVVSSNRPPGYEPGQSAENEDGKTNGELGSGERPSSAKGDESTNILRMFGLLPGELPEEDDGADSPSSDAERPGSSENVNGGPAAKTPRIRQPTSEQDAVKQMETDAVQRGTRILRSLVKRTSKAARSSANKSAPAATTSAAAAAPTVPAAAPAPAAPTET